MNKNMRVWGIGFLLILLMSCVHDNGGTGVSETVPVINPARPVLGVAVDPLSGTPLANAQVSVFIQSGVVAGVATAPVLTVATDTAGKYSLGGLSADTRYFLEISKTGYLSVRYHDVQPLADRELALESAGLVAVEQAALPVAARGVVRDAAAGDGLSAVTVNVRSGLNNRTGNVVATQTTSSSGAFSFDGLPAGAYTAEVAGGGPVTVATGFFVLYSVPAALAASGEPSLPVVVLPPGIPVYVVPLVSDPLPGPGSVTLIGTAGQSSGVYTSVGTATLYSGGSGATSGSIGIYTSSPPTSGSAGVYSTGGTLTIAGSGGIYTTSTPTGSSGIYSASTSTISSSGIYAVP